MGKFMMDPAMMIAAGVVGLGLLGLLVEMMLSGLRRAGARSRSPIMLMSEPRAAAAAVQPAAFAAPADAPAPAVAPAAAAPAASPITIATPPEPPKDPLAEQRRFFTTLGAALSANDEAPPATLAALHANLTADVFMERMALAAKGWRPDGFATGARDLRLRADGTPPDIVAAKVLEGYEQLKLGHVKDALEAFLGGIEAAKVVAAAEPGNPWPHSWSAFAWRGLALIAEEAGDVQATLAGLKVAYQSMVNAFEVTMQGVPEKLAQAA